jgi:hypothetical protein
MPSVSRSTPNSAAAVCDLCFLQSPHSFQIRSRCQVEAKLGSAHRRYQRAMTKSKLEIQRFADAPSPSSLRDKRDSGSLPVTSTSVSVASAADILDVHDTNAFSSDEEQEEDDHAANDEIAPHPHLQREFTRIFEQSEFKASRPRFPPCPSPFDCSAATWAARRRLAYHLFESPRSSTLVSLLSISNGDVLLCTLEFYSVLPHLSFLHTTLIGGFDTEDSSL